MTLPPPLEDRRWPFAAGGGATLAVATAVWGATLLLARRTAQPAIRLLTGATTLIWLILLYFFRDPNRPIAAEPGVMVSPADGEIVAIEREQETRYLQAEVIRISIFLSLFDVHVQRVPLRGTVTRVDHQPGKFLQAFRPEASDVNEFIAMVVEGEYGRYLVKQIAGILARRCVNQVSPGQAVRTGQRFGLIRFSSRVDLCLPPDAALLIQVGDKVVGGVTPIAHLDAAA